MEQPKDYEDRPATEQETTKTVITRTVIGGLATAGIIAFFVNWSTNILDHREITSLSGHISEIKREVKVLNRFKHEHAVIVSGLALKIEEINGRIQVLDGRQDELRLKFAAGKR